MQTTVLLLDEGTALALVGIVAILAVCLLTIAIVALAFVALRRRDQAYAVAAPTPASFPVPIPAPAVRAGGSRKKPAASRIKNVEIDVPTRHADAIINALHASGWLVRDTGEVVATDEDEEGLTTISVDVPAGTTWRPSSGEEVQ